MIWILLVGLAVWAWGWGYWAHECRPFEGLLAAACIGGPGGAPIIVIAIPTWSGGNAVSKNDGILTRTSDGKKPTMSKPDYVALVDDMAEAMYSTAGRNVTWADCVTGAQRIAWWLTENVDTDD